MCAGTSGSVGPSSGGVKARLVLGAAWSRGISSPGQESRRGATLRIVERILGPRLVRRFLSEARRLPAVGPFRVLGTVFFEPRIVLMHRAPCGLLARDAINPPSGLEVVWSVVVTLHPHRRARWRPSRKRIIRFECPQCKNQLTDYKRISTPGIPEDHNEHPCPDCGQVLIWDFPQVRDAPGPASKPEKCHHAKLKKPGAIVPTFPKPLRSIVKP
jgi:predicted RNA-binding Zn-ribbon protein involved in translation (DUF1610 family)